MLSNTSVHGEKAKPVLRRQCHFIFKGAGCHTSCATDSSKSVCSFPSISKPSQRQRKIFPRPVKPSGRSPTPIEERNHVSTGSRSIPQVARSFPNVTFPPPLETPCYSTFQSRGCLFMMFLTVKKREWNSKRFPHRQRSAVGSWISAQKFIVVRVIPLLQCQGFEQLRQPRHLTT